MLVSLLSVLALTSVVSSSALPVHPFTNVVARADTSLPGGATIPAACAATCASTLTVYSYCTDADARCLDICTPEGIAGFYDCVNCAFGFESFSASQYVALTSTANALSQTCAAAGKTVDTTASLTPYAQLSSMWEQPAFSSSAAAAGTQTVALTSAAAVASAQSVSSTGAAATASGSAPAVVANNTSAGSKTVVSSVAGLVAFALAGTLLA